MRVCLVVDGLGAGLHRLVVATGDGRVDQVVIGEVGRAAPARLALADVLVECGQRSSAASRALIVAAFGFPVGSSARASA
ncbi:hypothetical protein ABZ816_17465 [Actinosynnema sp. NPDC047251]|uniref:Uncharacterized protein n=1 Tax=Saccharothrix espanaensis (strain ATCC 51144 / DSM 44229 / JCM 9112 / NBRC 15066 / NRRL 15764) TaxID=1179773 RepID=K0JRN6_SACES|nr:hypothetical protein [Saccharothrix espanaensis]CCH30315.1 hypothetical protein BN6_30080 [Saccharothrix espanaensis DSM 44229]